jgi:hypothetical protein
MENKKEISWIDLDHTLILTDAKWWILDKNNPDKPLFKVSQYDGTLIRTGFHKGDNLPIYYNGIPGFLSKEIWEKIQRIKKFKLEDIGVSYREYTDASLINEHLTNCVFYIDRFKSLKDHTIKILTARGNKEGHLGLISLLETKMDEAGLKLNDSYFVNDPKQVQFGTNSAERKLLCIIEKIVGYKIQDMEFTHVVDETYDISNFFDDEDHNISICKDINKFIRFILTNTEEWLQEKIKASLNSRKPILRTHLVTSNEMNPFYTEEIKIEI